MKKAKRINPKEIKDLIVLSQLLRRYLDALQAPPFNIPLSTLSVDARIDQSIFQRLLLIEQNPEDAQNIRPEDYHILFSNITFLHPTLKMWRDSDGSIFFEM